MLVSVCIPTYSRLNYLKQAVQSARNQTYSDVEICVSQNPKEDGPDEVIKNWCENEVAKNNLVYNLNENNLGLTGNLNVLVNLAKGEYLIFIGDDDLLHPDFIKNLLDAAKKYKPAVIFSNQFFIDVQGLVLEKETEHLNNMYKRNFLPEGVIPDAVNAVFNNSVPLSASLIRKDLFKTFTFNEQLNTPELPFFLRIALNNGVFFYVNRKLAYYRLHKNSETFSGLATEELLKELMSISIPEEYRHLKKNYIQNAIIPSINKAILKGDGKLARLLIRSEYYPNKKYLKLIQELMSFLPLNMIKVLFKFRKAI